MHQPQNAFGGNRYSVGACGLHSLHARQQSGGGGGGGGTGTGTGAGAGAGAGTGTGTGAGTGAKTPPLSPSSHNKALLTRAFATKSLTHSQQTKCPHWKIANVS